MAIANRPRSIDIVAAREYNYQYEDGKLIRATEAMVEFTNEMVTSKVIVNSIQYYYNAEDKMIKKVNTSANGFPQIIYYENVDDSTVVKFEIPAPTAENPEHKQMVTSHSKIDSFGRKLFDELQLGTGFVSRQFQG